MHISLILAIRTSSYSFERVRLGALWSETAGHLVIESRGSHVVITGNLAYALLRAIRALADCLGQSFMHGGDRVRCSYKDDIMIGCPKCVCVRNAHDHKYHYTECAE